LVFSLSTVSETELRGLYHKTFNALVKSTPESTEQRNAFASLENIQKKSISVIPISGNLMQASRCN
jgi:hypothetical protein